MKIRNGIQSETTSLVQYSGLEIASLSSRLSPASETFEVDKMRALRYHGVRGTSVATPILLRSLCPR